MTTTGTSTTPTFEHSCTLERNGELYEHMMLNDTAESILLSVWGAEGCTLRVLVVGGGGSGTYMAGAGSGYIEYQTLAIPPGDTPVRALVGGPGHRQTCKPCLTIFCNNLIRCLPAPSPFRNPDYSIIKHCLHVWSQVHGQCW